MGSKRTATQRRKAAILRAVQDQLESAETPEVRLHYQRLLSLGHSGSEARDLIAALLTFYIWHTQRGVELVAGLE